MCRERDVGYIEGFPMCREHDVGCIAGLSHMQGAWKLVGRVFEPMSLVRASLRACR